MTTTGRMSNSELSLSITNLIQNIFDNNIKTIFDEHKREIDELKDTIVDLKNMITNLTNLKVNDTKSYANALSKNIEQSINKSSIAKTISNKIAIEINLNKKLLIFGLSQDEQANTLMKDLGVDEKAYSKQKIITDNGNLIVKICLNDSITVKELLSTFSKHPDRHTQYDNISLRPDLSYDERLKRIILPIGANALPGNIRCVFNNSTQSYELKNYKIDNEKYIIDLNTTITYSDTDYSNWKKTYNSNKQSKSNNSNKHTPDQVSK